MPITHVNKTKNEVKDIYIPEIAVENLLSHISVLASSQMQGRGVLDSGEIKASEYIISEFAKTRLVPGNWGKWVQPFSLPLYLDTLSNSVYYYLNEVDAKDLCTNCVRMDSVEFRNVIGLMKGTDSVDKFLVIGAHFDHRGNRRNGKIFHGADDNASGVAVLIEIAREISELLNNGYILKKNIAFIAFSGEELGLLGSNYYVNNPIFPLNETIAMLNFDMLGRIGYKYENHKDSINYIFAIGADSVKSNIKHSLSKVISSSKMFIDFEDEKSLYTRSDQYNFKTSAIPSILFTNGDHRDYHRVSDTTDKIDCALLRKRALFILNVILHIIDE
jgi:hypothetical protein